VTVSGKSANLRESFRKSFCTRGAKEQRPQVKW
jgi:hypothetical protein